MSDLHRSLDDQPEISVDQHPDVIAEQESYQSALANLDEARPISIRNLLYRQRFPYPILQVAPQQRPMPGEVMF